MTTAKRTGGKRAAPAASAPAPASAGPEAPATDANAPTPAPAQASSPAPLPEPTPAPTPEPSPAPTPAPSPEPDKGKGKGKVKPSLARLFPRTITVRNNSGFPLVDPVSGMHAQAGGAAQVTLHDEDHAYRVLENIHALLKRNYVTADKVSIEGLPTADEIAGSAEGE